MLHCIREYRGDEKVREFVWRLIVPKGGQVSNASKNFNQKKGVILTSVFHEGWAALPEYNPPAFAVDSSFQRHVHRHSNKLLVRMHQLHILNSEVTLVMGFLLLIFFVLQNSATVSSTRFSLHHNRLRP